MSETVVMSSTDRPPVDDPAARMAKARAANPRSHPGRQRSAITNGSKLLAGVDGRSPWIRRAKDLIAEHLADLGGESNVSAGERSLIRRAATITTELEFLEARFAVAEDGAKPDDLDLYLRASNNLRRLLEAIGLQRRMRDVTVDPLAYARNIERGAAP
jgi:hypothetical protein